MTTPLIRGRVTRLRVFAVLKSEMLRTGECPHPRTVSSIMGLPQRTVYDHMLALDGASGLPLRVQDFRTGSATKVELVELPVDLLMEAFDGAF